MGGDGVGGTGEGVTVGGGWWGSWEVGWFWEGLGGGGDRNGVGCGLAKYFAFGDHYSSIFLFPFLLQVLEFWETVSFLF